MAFYETCPRCGANLDPGEHCNCEQEEKRRRERLARAMRADPKTGQLAFVFERKGDGYAATGIC